MQRTLSLFYVHRFFQESQERQCASTASWVITNRLQGFVERNWRLCQKPLCLVMQLAISMLVANNAIQQCKAGS